MNLNDLFNEEKVRLDPKCWTGKKIGNPKTKVKGGVRVNNCVPAESVEEGSRASNEIGGADSMRQKLGDIIKQAAQDDEIAYNKPGLYRKLWITYGGDIDAIIAERSIFELQQLARELVTANKQGMAEAKFPTPQDNRNFQDQADYGGEDPDARDQYGNLKRSTSPGLGGSIDIGGVDIPAGAFDAGLGSAAAMGGLRGMFGKSKEAPVTEPKWASSRIPGVDVHTGPPPTVTKSSNINTKIDPASDVPAYVRKGLPDPVTVPKPGTKPKVSVKPGETMDQAMQRTKAEQEFGRFLQGQGGQSFGTPTAGAGRGTVNPEPTKSKEKKQDLPKTYADVQMSQYNDYLNNKQQALKDHPEPYWAAMRDREFAQFKKEKGYNHPDWYEFDDYLFKNSLQKKSQADKKARANTPRQKSQYDLDQDAKKRGAWKNPDTDIELEEASRKKREQPEVNYDDEYDAMVARVKKLAGLGPMKTVYDPTKRQYRNMPTAVQPKK